MGSYVTFTELSLKHLMETCHNCTKNKPARMCIQSESEWQGKGTDDFFFSFLCCETVIRIRGAVWHSQNVTDVIASSKVPHSPEPVDAEQEDPAEVNMEVGEFVDVTVKCESSAKSPVCEDDSCEPVLENDPLKMDDSATLHTDKGGCGSAGQAETEPCVTNNRSINKSLRKNFVGILGQQDMLGMHVSSEKNKFPGVKKGRIYPLTFTCEFCGKVFKGKERAYQFYYHRNREHTQEKTFKCDRCPKTFWGDREFLSHRVQHTYQGNVCHICGRKLNSIKNLRAHLLIHSQTREHICHYCDKTFRRKDHLRVHERIHTGVRPYQCQWCDAGYPQKHQLKLHSRKCPVQRQTDAKLNGT